MRSHLREEDHLFPCPLPLLRLQETAVKGAMVRIGDIFIEDLRQKKVLADWFIGHTDWADDVSFQNNLDWLLDVCRAFPVNQVALVSLLRSQLLVGNTDSSKRLVHRLPDWKVRPLASILALLGEWVRR